MSNVYCEGRWNPSSNCQEKWSQALDGEALLGHFSISIESIRRGKILYNVGILSYYGAKVFEIVKACVFLYNIFYICVSEYSLEVLFCSYSYIWAERPIGVVKEFQKRVWIFLCTSYILIISSLSRQKLLPMHKFIWRPISKTLLFILTV